MKYIAIIIYLSTIFSCSTIKSVDEVRIPTGTYLVKLKSETIKIQSGTKIPNDVKVNYFQIYSATDSCTAIIDISKNKTEIKILDTTRVMKENKIDTNVDLDLIDDSEYKIPYKLQYKGNLEKYAEDSIKFKLYKNRDKKGAPLSIGDKFKYRKVERIEQAITIPFKIRPRIEDRPYELTTGINAGFSYGFKWAWNNTRTVFKESNKNVIGYENQTKSIVISPFIGLTANSLSTANSNIELESARNILGVNYGFAAVIGINKFDFGIAIGKDFGFGSVADSWVYQNKTWYGLVLGLELFE